MLIDGMKKAMNEAMPEDDIAMKFIKERGLEKEFLKWKLKNEDSEE